MVINLKIQNTIPLLGDLMARRRRSKIGFQSGEEFEVGEEITIHPPLGNPSTASEHESETTPSVGGEPNEDILPVFAATDKDELSTDTDNIADQYPDDAYFEQPQLKDHLSSVNIDDRKGNYLISVGLPGSGKTVLQSFTTYSMSVAGNLSSKPDITEKNGEINHQAQQLRTLWLDEWKVGRLPKGTPLREDEIREIRLDITNLENKSQKFNFSFLEISGESFKDVVPTAISAPTLFQRINSFLTNNKIRLNLAFVLKTDEQLGEPTNDALFTNFIEFVESQLKLDLTKKVGLILVLPNPKMVFGEEEWRVMRSNKPEDRNFYKKRVKDYVYENFPATYTIFDRWNVQKRAITIFHVGDEVRGHIQNVDFKDARSFIDLNYQFFTGGRLQPKNSFWKRIFGSK